jgi:hypothetical protein
MKLAAIVGNVRAGAIALVAGLTLCTASFAAPGLGRAGFGGYHGGYGGYHGGYGGYGGYGWHGGYGWRGGYYGGWGWGWGALGVGLYFATLPYYYSTVWWGGVPYYYAYNNYYVWNPTASAYETVAPPAGIANAVADAPAGGQAPAATELFAYPKNGQTTEQQAKDRYECHRWASDQTGFDPSSAAVSMGGSVAPPAGNAGAPPPAGRPSPAKRQDYLRAQAACLEGRGYTAR